MVKARTVLLSSVAGVIVVSAGAGFLLAATVDDPAVTNTYVVQTVSILALLTVLVASAVWMVVVAVRARRLYGQLDVGAAQRRQVDVSLRRGEIAADPETRALTEREAQRQALLSPAVVIAYSLNTATFGLIGLTSDLGLVRWAQGVAVLCFATLVVSQAVQWRRAIRYLKLTT